MNKSITLQTIKGIIEGGVSIKDFAAVTKTDEKMAKAILERLMEKGIGTVNSDKYYFSKGDKLKTALYALRQGVDLEEISELLSWQDFEGLTAEILEEKGFITMKNFRLEKPKREIDVIGIKNGIAILVDCKHWKRTNMSILNEIVEKQIERTKQYVSKTQGAMAIPAIVTLYQEKISFIKKVPIVPIYQLPSFIDELYGNLEDLETIKTDLQ